MTATWTKTRKKKSSFHDGREGKYPCNLAKNSWMEEKALYSLGIRNPEKFTSKLCAFL